MRKFSIYFSNNLAKTERIIETNLQSRIKISEENLKNEEYFNAYNVCKLKLENIYDKKATCANIRSKSGWYQTWRKTEKNFF